MSWSNRHTILVTLLTAVIAAGCASLSEAWGPAESDAPRSSRPATGSDDRGRSPADERVRRVARGQAPDWMEVYARYDETAFDPVEAGVVIATCHMAGPCRYENGSESFSPGAIATRYELAQRIDPGQLVHRLRRMPLRPEIRRAFFERVRAARAHILEVVPQLDVRWKKVFVLPVQRTRRLRRTERQGMPAIAERWRALRDQVTAALRKDTVHLGHRLDVEEFRQRYLEACRSLGRRTLECLGQAPARSAARLIARVATALGDPATARLEWSLLRLVPDRERLQHDLRAAVADAMAEHARLYAAYAEARRHESDPERLRERFGDPPPLDVRGLQNRAGAPLPATDELPPPSADAVLTLRGEVRSILRHPDGAVLELARGQAVRVPDADAAAVELGQVAELLYVPASQGSRAPVEARLLRVFDRESRAVLTLGRFSL